MSRKQSRYQAEFQELKVVIQNNNRLLQILKMVFIAPSFYIVLCLGTEKFTLGRFLCTRRLSTVVIREHGGHVPILVSFIKEVIFLSIHFFN